MTERSPPTQQLRSVHIPHTRTTTPESPREDEASDPTEEDASDPTEDEASDLAVVHASDPAVADGPVSYESLVADAADVTMVSTADGVYRYVSPASERVFGWEAGDLEGCREEEFLHPDDMEAFGAVRGTNLTPDDTATATYRFRCADGSYRWCEATARRATDASDLIVSTLRDITGRRQHAIAWQHRALTDPLTGVANRTVLMDRLEQALRRLERASGVLAVLYIDMDQFKVVNDSLGHRVGDTVLLKMAERLTHHLRPADTLARLGGDEFVVLAEHMADERAVLELGNRIVEAGREPFRVGDKDFVCTVSVGIASIADAERTADEILGDADLALYRAKGRGRDRVEIFDDELRSDELGRRGTERMLRSALDEGRVVVEYQPIIGLETGHAVGAEALVRIRDHDRRLIGPQVFLEVAERTGLLAAMDAHVFNDAIAQAAVWQVRLAGTAFCEVTVNVTGHHLADAGFHAAVIDQLDAHGLPHDFLVLEVTEHVLMAASNSAMSGLRVLREAGVRVALDDFGIGYTSLAALRVYPLDVLKIERSIVEGLELDTVRRALVSSVIGLAHALDLAVVAEGVETTGQLDILRSLGCDQAQGYLFAASGAPDTIDDLVCAAAATPEPALSEAQP